MRTCCIYAVLMPSPSPAPPLAATGSAPSAPSPAPAVKQPPAADRVYTHVKQGVLDRRYEGGTLLTEGELAEAVGVSRTPVREALLRLEAEGLIRLYPKKGALVLPVSSQEIADVVETRMLVEQHAVRKVVPASPTLIARLEELLDRQKEQAAAGDLAGAAVTDRCFHAEIVRSGGNEILSRLYDQLRPPAPDGRRHHALAPRPHRQDAHRARGDPRRAAHGDAEAAAGIVHQHVDWFSHLARGEVR